MNHLQAVLKILAANDIRTSGNLESQIRDLELEVALELADTSYEIRKTDEEEAFALGLELGRIADKNGVVYQIELDSHMLYFIGKESDILRKIEDKKEEMKESTLEE